MSKTQITCPCVSYKIQTASLQKPLLFSCLLKRQSDNFLSVDYCDIRYQSWECAQKYSEMHRNQKLNFIFSNLKTTVNISYSYSYTVDTQMALVATSGFNHSAIVCPRHKMPLVISEELKSQALFSPQIQVFKCLPRSNTQDTEKIVQKYFEVHFLKYPVMQYVT